MPATLWLLTCVLAQGPDAPPPPRRAQEHALAPRLDRNQELVYRGSFRERSDSGGVRHERAYRVEARFLVLDVEKSGAEVAALTLVQDRSPRPTRPAKGEPTSASARLERLKVDNLGKVSGPLPASLLVPVEGPPTLEIGTFVPVPAAKLKVGQAWEVKEAGRPNVAWMVSGGEMISGRSCFKVTAVQQADEWDRPRADRGAWKRVDTVWIDPRAGHAVRVERTIEQREPARRETSQTSTLRLDLESSVRQPGYLTDSARHEIGKALDFRKQALPLLPNPTKASKQLGTLQRRIAQYLEWQPATSYREAVLGVKRVVDAACKGEVVTVQYTEAPKEPARAAIGTVAPDFLATEITGTGSAKLSRWKGKPILLAFYHPASATADELLKFAGGVHGSLGRHVSVVGMSVSDDAAAVLKQRAALKVDIPVLHAGGLRASYAVEATPKIVLIDAEGIVRGSYLGWGRETATDVMADLRRLLAGR